MTTRRPRVVIVGAGPCGASAASALRAGGFDGDVVLVGEEDEPPYERPPLSKEWLAGGSDRDSLLVRPAAWYAEHAVELRTGTRVDAVDGAAREVVLSSGSRLGFDQLLIATGGRPRRLPGLTSDRVQYLRTVRDSDDIRRQLGPGERLVVLGGGFIGCEVAATARKLGVEVTILEALDHPLQRVLGADVGRVFGDIHRDAGVELRTGERVESVAETSAGLAVHTDRGVLECSSLLVAVGLERDTTFLHDSGIACDDGVLVDGHCETSVPGIFAAGDVAAHQHPRYGRVRVEHHDNALKQGAAAARNMLGERVAYDDPHWFWSDQYEHTLQSVGIADTRDEVVVRGNMDEGSFAVFSLAGGRLVAVLGLNRAKDVLAGRKLITSGQHVTADELRDESVDLRRLSRPAGARGARRGRQV